jgi:hypothetical protein
VPACREGFIIGQRSGRQRHSELPRGMSVALTFIEDLGGDVDETMCASGSAETLCLATPPYTRLEINVGSTNGPNLRLRMLNDKIRSGAN